jgi:hypothetical protein
MASDNSGMIPAFMVQGAFEFYILDVGQTHQEAMDEVRNKIEEVGGRVLEKDEVNLYGVRFTPDRTDSDGADSAPVE